jgi:integrase
MTELVASQPKWPEWAAGAAPRDLDKRQALFAYFAKWMAKNVPSLWSGEPDPGYSAEHLETQLANLLATETELTVHRIFANWWDTLLGEGHRLRRWKIRPGSQRIKLPSDHASFVRRDFQLLEKFRQIEAAFLDRIQSPLEPDQCRDAFMLSAVMNGGILSVGRLNALHAWREDAVHGINGVLWVTLDLPVSGSSNYRPIKWYPDALTATLLTKVLANRQSLKRATGVHPHQPTPSAHLETTLANLGLLPWQGDVREFLRAARTSTALATPGFVAAYLAEDIESHSLPDPVFRRILGVTLPIPEKPPVEQMHAPPKASEVMDLASGFDPDLPRTSQLAIARQACKALGNKRGAIERLKLILESHQCKMWPITQALIGWTMWRLDPSCSLGKIKASSAQTYLRTLALHLIYEAEDLDLLDLDVDDFEALYEHAARRVSKASRRAYFWGRLRDFHDYLFLAGAPDIDLRELDGWVATGSVRVSANLITEGEFLRFKGTLRTDETHPAAEKVLLAGVLGYRTGLRRREVQMLRIQDIHPGTEPLLLIRPSKLASLKSNSAKRRIPLRPLLPADELATLMNYHARRSAQTEGKDSLLFADPDSPWTPAPYSTLVDPVTALFGAITNEAGVRFRFHHLRHSFANWILCALLATDEPELLRQELPFLDAHLLCDETQLLLRDSLYPVLEGTEHYPERRHVFQVAALMGHLGPGTTCQSYLHLLDWISGRYLDLALDHRLRNLDSAALGRLCGLSISMPYKREYRDLAHRATSFMRHHVKTRNKARALVIGPQPQHSLPRLGTLIAPTLPTPFLLITVLRRHFSGDSIQKLESIFSIPAKALTAAAEAYRRMYAKQSVRNAKATIPIPRAPRVAQQQREYFRIMDNTYTSARRSANRSAMSAAAEALVQRTGPKTGKLYFGTKGRDFAKIVTGLFHLGIESSEMTLVIQRPAAIEVERDSVTTAVRHAQNEGIRIEERRLEWGKRTMKGTLVRLDVQCSQADASSKYPSWEGRVRGLNHAAAWIRFIDRLPNQIF